VEKEQIHQFKGKATYVEMCLTDNSLFLIPGDNPAGKRNQPIESVCEDQVFTVDSHCCEIMHYSET